VRKSFEGVKMADKKQKNDFEWVYIHPKSLNGHKYRSFGL
jgi:hypothetical protein